MILEARSIRRRRRRRLHKTWLQIIEEIGASGGKSVGERDYPKIRENGKTA